MKPTSEAWSKLENGVREAHAVVTADSSESSSVPSFDEPRWEADRPQSGAHQLDDRVVHLQERDDPDRCSAR